MDKMKLKIKIFLHKKFYILKIIKLTSKEKEKLQYLKTNLKKNFFN